MLAPLLLCAFLNAQEMPGARDIADEVLGALPQEAALKAMNASQRRGFIKGLLKLTGTDATLLEHRDANTKAVSFSTICGTNIFALKIAAFDELTEKDFAQFRKNCEEVKPGGIVVDLRDADGDDTVSARLLLDALPHGMRLAVLVNAGTTRLAESVAADLRKRGALLMGQNTAGKPGARRQLTLKSGDIILVPKATQNSPTIPDVVLAPDSKRWLTTAADTLVFLNLLQSTAPKPKPANEPLSHL